MEIKKAAVAGTLESSDCQIVIRPNPGRGLELELDSSVKLIFGDSILETAREVLSEFEVSEAAVEICDKGALDCVIRARMECVICRGGNAPYDWSGKAAHGETGAMEQGMAQQSVTPQSTVREVQNG